MVSQRKSVGPSWDLSTRAGDLQGNALNEPGPRHGPWQAQLHRTGVQICSCGLFAPSTPRPQGESLRRGASHWSPQGPSTHMVLTSFSRLLPSHASPSSKVLQFLKVRSISQTSLSFLDLMRTILSVENIYLKYKNQNNIL